MKACIETAEETIGRKSSDKKSESAQIKNLSSMQKKLRNDINATSDPGKRAEKKKERNKVLKEIHDALQREQQTEIMRLVEEVERHKDDSRKMFQVVKQLQRRKEKKKIIVNGEHGVTTNEVRQVEIVTHFFNDMFNKDTERKIK